LAAPFDWAQGDRNAKHALSDVEGGAKNKKFEARKRPRGPKSETISNDQNKKNSKQASVGFGVLDFLNWDLSVPAFVSVRGVAFDIKISDFFLGASCREVK
jgi:hypothetical protein